MQVIFERRSVRNFLPKPVEAEKVERILRAGFEAPAALGIFDCYRKGRPQSHCGYESLRENVRRRGRGNCRLRQSETGGKFRSK
ncbi:MAG: nitroreductase family protein [Treponema sp.]|nr:nitroreductase family protein [Treponema sp.]